MKKIKTIHLQRFRQFSDVKINVSSFNLLVGPNNCGKTTILHAIRAFYSLMNNSVQIEGDKAKYHRRFLSSADEIAPTPDIRELWFAQKIGKPITISITFEDDVTISVSLRYQFGQLHVSSESIPDEFATNEIIETYLGTQVAFIPGLVGVLVSEPYATPARRNALAAQGRYSEIFRSSLRQLKAKDESLLTKINTPLTDLFGIGLSSVTFDEESDEFVTVKYNQENVDYDVVSSGAGLQQVIQMLTYLYISQPRILLIDEPDAHLHSKLQAKLGELFRRVAIDLDAQIFMSTHSLDLIDTFTTDQVIVVDSSQKELQALGKNTDLVSALIDADIVDVSALSRLLSSRKLVVVEDKDQTILKAIDKVSETFLYSSQSSTYVLSAKGVSNFRAVKELGNVLLSMAGKKFDITFIQDRDGMADFLVQDFINSQKEAGINVKLLDRHEIENYLIEPNLLIHAAKMKNRDINKTYIEEKIFEVATNLRSDAQLACRDCALGVNRHLPNKRNEKDLERDVFDWFNELDLTDLITIQKVFPGKEFIKQLLLKINEDANEDQQITKGLIIGSLEKQLIAPDIIQLIQSLI